ncbi:hypothetical protein BS17DRAFT_763576 [Gyrodon lividus]|nr:hypothetical protein BS17DRAFT_763576 [Gyrodon lividus]
MQLISLPRSPSTGNVAVLHTSSGAASDNGGMSHLHSHEGPVNEVYMLYGMAHLSLDEGTKTELMTMLEARVMVYDSDNSRMSSHAASVQEVHNDKYDSLANG